MQAFVTWSALPITKRSRRCRLTSDRELVKSGRPCHLLKQTIVFVTASELRSQKPHPSSYALLLEYLGGIEQGHQPRADDQREQISNVGVEVGDRVSHKTFARGSVGISRENGIPRLSN